MQAILSNLTGGVSASIVPADITAVANYVYSLCTGYNLQAAVIIAAGGGGTITPAAPSGYIYTSLGFTVTDDNVSTFQTPYLIGGKDLAFVIYNDLLLTLAKGEFTVNYTTGVVSFTTVSLFVGDSLTFSFNKKL